MSTPYASPLRWGPEVDLPGNARCITAGVVAGAAATATASALVAWAPWLFVFWLPTLAGVLAAALVLGPRAEPGHIVMTSWVGQSGVVAILGLIGLAWNGDWCAAMCIFVAVAISAVFLGVLTMPTGVLVHRLLRPLRRRYHRQARAQHWLRDSEEYHVRS